jgi:hypothetical protein
MALINPKIWTLVPDGSELFVKATATNDNFSIDMSVDSSADDHSVVNHAKIVAGANITLHAPNEYAITVRVNFAGTPAPTVNFSARITEPGGAQHDGSYEFSVSDPNGSPYRALIGVVMAGGGSH